VEPFSADDLIRVGYAWARDHGVPVDLRDDVAQEFAIGGTGAVDRTGANPRGLQFMAGMRNAIDFLRKNIRDDDVASLDDIDLDTDCPRIDSVSYADDYDTILEKLCDEESYDLADAALQSLDERSRDISRLVILDGHTQSHVASIYGINQCTVSRIISSAIEKIKNMA
jgi:RNA polymerase sigma factor (sigma-70 family)